MRYYLKKTSIMNCEQKSGIFLNIKCSNTAEHECDTCEKQICKIHVHRYNDKDLCENCYWETYIYTTERVTNDYDHHNETTIIGFPTGGTGGTASNNSDSNPTGFEEGFGGGEFGGGGATGSWTEGDAQSFNDTSTDTNGGLLGGTDSTFFYS